MFVSGRDETSIKTFKSVLGRDPKSTVAPDDVALVRDPVLSDKLLSDKEGSCWKRSAGEHWLWVDPVRVNERDYRGTKCHFMMRGGSLAVGRYRTQRTRNARLGLSLHINVLCYLPVAPARSDPREMNTPANEDRREIKFYPCRPSQSVVNHADFLHAALATCSRFAPFVLRARGSRRRRSTAPLFRNTRGQHGGHD